MGALLSTVIVFNRNFFRYNANIQDCFSVNRKSRLMLTVNDRPWVNGLNRLLAERGGLKKGQLAEVGNLRPALISAVANSPKPPDIKSLLRIAEAFTAYDRKFNPNAPGVELWEFFVSDEQAAALRDRASKTRAESSEETLLKRAAEMFAESLRQARAEQAEGGAAQDVNTKKRKHG